MNPEPVVAFLPWADRFEDFHDKVGISLEDFRDGLTGTWLFNYVEALQTAGVRSVLYFVSARVPGVVRFTHRATGAPVRFLPAPMLHRKLQGARDRFRLDSPLVSSVLSYAATPWRALATEMRRDGCEAIICQEYEFPRFDEAVLLGRVLRMPVFATYQAGNAPGSALERPFRRAAIRRAAGLMIGARSEMQRVRSAYGIPAERTVWVPNALDVRRWQPLDRGAARAPLGIPLDATVIAWQGRVAIHQKGLDVLADAWQRLCAAVPCRKLLLLIVGSGQDDEVLQYHMASLSAGTVRWERRFVLDRELLWRYLSAADIAILPSRHEGFSVFVVEAMACGLPVVATDVSGVAEALGPEPVGVIVPPENPSALADALRRLVDDEPLRRDLGARARRRAEEKFSIQAVGMRLRAFMEERGAFRRHPRRECADAVAQSHVAGGDAYRQPLRIAHVIDAPFAMDSANGASEVVHCLGRAQAEMGHTIMVFSSVDGAHRLGRGTDSKRAASRVPPEPAATRLRERLLSRYVDRNFIEGILSWAPDIVHFHSVHVPRHVALAARLRRAGIPYCVTVHGGLFPAALQRSRVKKAAFNFLFERQYLNDACFVHALSPEEAAAIRGYGVECPTMVAPNGLPPDVRLQPNRPDALYRANPSLRGRQIFMFIGRLDPWQKGLDLLLEAFERAGPGEATLVLVGPDRGGSRRSLEQRADRIGIRPRIVFTGPAFGADRANLLAAADVFVHPSRWEGLSLSVLRAAAAGKPCLITRCADPLGELERANAAVIVEPTVPGIAAGLGELSTLGVGDLRAMGARARHVAETHVAWPTVAGRLMTAYLSAVDTRHEPRVGAAERPMSERCKPAEDAGERL